MASVALVTCGFVMMMGLFGTGDAPEVGESAVVEVRVGDTLWGIANRVAPDSDPRLVVQRIVEANDLGSPSLEAGRHLVVPVER